MTRQRDIERVLDHWFTERPTEVSDRVLDEVADRIGRQPQQPAWLPTWRDSHLNSYLRYAVAVAAVILVVAVGFAFFGSPSGSNVGGGAPATPSSSPTASPPDLPGDGTPALQAHDYVARALPGDSLAFTVTAPRGWFGTRSGFIESPWAAGPHPEAGIAFLRNPQVVDNPCSPSGSTPSTAPSGGSVDDLVAALSALEGVQVSGVTEATLGGYWGKRLDLQLPAELPCLANGRAPEYYVFAEPQRLYANGPASNWRVWLLDVDGDTAVVVLMDYAGTPAGDRAAAQAAIDSVRITP